MVWRAPYPERRCSDVWRRGAERLVLRVAPELVRLSWPWSALTCGSLLCVAPSRSARMRDISRSALPLRRSGLSDNCDMVVAAVVCVAAPKEGVSMCG